MSLCPYFMMSGIRGSPIPPCLMQDLCDRLWDICDVRRDEWEVEQNRIMTESWVEDHLGLLINIYISLMQVSCVVPCTIIVVHVYTECLLSLCV